MRGPTGGSHLPIPHALRLLEPTKKTKSEGSQKDRSEAKLKTIFFAGGFFLRGSNFWTFLIQFILVLTKLKVRKINFFGWPIFFCGGGNIKN